MEENKNLTHEAALTVTVRINLGVKLVHQARLLLVIGDGVAGVGVVSIRPGAVLTKCFRKPVFLRMDTAVLGKVIVLLAVVTCDTCSSTGKASTCSSTSQLTLAESSGIVAVTCSVLKVTMPGSSGNEVVVLVTLALANGAEATGCSCSNVLRYALEGVVALLTTSKGSALVLELIHGHGR